MLLSAMKQVGPATVKVPIGVDTVHGLETTDAWKVVLPPAPFDATIVQLPRIEVELCFDELPHPTMNSKNISRNRFIVSLLFVGPPMRPVLRCFERVLFAVRALGSDTHVPASPLHGDGCKPILAPGALHTSSFFAGKAGSIIQNHCTTWVMAAELPK